MTRMLGPLREPNDLDLRRFAVAMPLALCVLGGVVAWRAGWAWGLPPWGLAVVLGAVGVALPRARRPIWRGFTIVTRPIGRLVSLGVLAVVYCGVLTPMGLVARMVRGDRLGRRPDRGASSYWEPAEPPEDPERRFRPF